MVNQHSCFSSIVDAQIHKGEQIMSEKAQKDKNNKGKQQGLTGNQPSSAMENPTNTQRNKKVHQKTSMELMTVHQCKRSAYLAAQGAGTGCKGKIWNHYLGIHSWC